MGSKVALSDSDLNTGSVTSRAPPPILRSLVVAPANHQLGSRGWDAGAGPSRAHVAHVAGGSAPAAATWQTRESRRARVARRALERERVRDRERRPLPAARTPPGGSAARIPLALHGCCYNCGLEGHISAECTNATLCVRCGGTEHTSRECKRPRSTSGGSPPPRDAPPLRAPLRPTPRAPRAAAPAPVGYRSGDALPRPPPPVPAAVHGRSWRDEVSSTEGSEEDSSPVGFSAPFAPSSSPPPPSFDSSALPRQDRPPSPELPDLCYVAPSAGMVQLEDDLDRAVTVTVV
ncbi:hypothetical protein QYE76_069945 [Lolium multiflorum]|uniref:CCHC-type domain-containing protein n=1 Tax=Lolium multiflorum TaxID=4521 RepID=A0AAD8SJQ4_LOLMU|nr:hypothetical protein QYE76_069945 [Lolium multiflorum]